MRWNWQLPDWPDFTYDAEALRSLEAAFLRDSGRISGTFSHLDSLEQDGIRIELLTDEGMQTSRIEGEILDRQSVQASLQQGFGLKVDRQRGIGPRERGIADLLVDNWQRFANPLDDKMLCGWHRKLMLAQLEDTSLGSYRTGDEPMQIVTGDPFDPEVHFEAPPSSTVAGEMSAFLNWFNETTPNEKNIPISALTRSALTHLRFQSIHPFVDGNGRIGRAISEKALFQATGRPLLVALSETIEAERKQYYEALAATRFTNETTEWIVWFGGMVLKSIHTSLQRIEFVIQKTRFFDRFGDRFNPRQAKALRRMFREGPSGFEGGLSAGNYLTITKTSAATARRDLGELVRMGALAKTGQRKGTRYFLMLGNE
ncbi:MAG: Fic family protein [Verrucomicrobiae bacterium]|nr:Fic family protein [Verrucomicrobiae bacterium]